MSEEVFISYRRAGGVETAKLVSETLKARGYSVFFDYDSLQGGQFDVKIYTAIEKCNDFLLILSPGALDSCTNDTDWVRYEIRHALKHSKNIVPVMLPGFDFPKELPSDIKSVASYNAVQFVMAYYDSVIDTLTDRLATRKKAPITQKPASKNVFRMLFVGRSSTPKEDTKTFVEPDYTVSEGLDFEECNGGYSVTGIGSCRDKCIVVPAEHNGRPVVRVGAGAFQYLWDVYKIVVPEGVTRIEYSAFLGISSLECVVLPSTLEEIGENAMIGPDRGYGYATPEEIIYRGTKKTWKSVTLGNVWSAPINVTCTDGIADCRRFRYLIKY